MISLSILVTFMARNPFKYALIITLYAMASAVTILPAWKAGLSFFTYHALSGLMAIKHQIAVSLIHGDYPLWNPMLMNGMPFHSGIGILDPLLISYFFCSGIKALILSSAIALFCAGLFMHLYLRQIFGLSHLASFLGGILYLSNPFFAATCHELPFMAPPIYLPIILLFFEQSLKKRSWRRAVLSGFFLALVFFSGNLESFFFVTLFFVSIQVSRWIVKSVNKRSLECWGSEFKYLIIAISSAFLFAAVDLLPTIEVLSDVARQKDARVLHNLLHFASLAFLTVLLLLLGPAVRRLLGNKVKVLKRALVLILFIVFSLRFDWKDLYLSFASNVFFPSIEWLMADGRDAFYTLIKITGISPSLLDSFLSPRFIFYLQPPAYLFTLSTLVLFSVVLVYGSKKDIGVFGIFAFFLALFPYTSFPNMSDHLLGLSDLNPQRLMFGFFFAQALIIAFGFEKVVSDPKVSDWSQKNIRWCVFGIASSILAGIFVLGVASMSDAGQLELLLREFRDVLGQTRPLWLTWKHLEITFSCLGIFLRQNNWVWFFTFSKFLSLALLFAFLMKPKSLWKYIFVMVLSFEALSAWTFYVFQTTDIQTLLKSHKEGLFVQQLSQGVRIGTRHNPVFSPRTYYENPPKVELAGNLPVFWDVMTIEQSAINLLPSRGKRFWVLEAGNKSYTPTYLEVDSSPIYDLMGMNYLFSDFGVADPSYRFVAQGDRYGIYENTKALPRFYFSRHILSADDESIAEMVKRNAWDPHAVTYVTGSVPDGFQESERSENGIGAISVLEIKNNELLLNTSSERSEFLASAEAFHKNWRVWVDGKGCSVEQTNFYFRGVFLPPGRHRIHFKYDPFSFHVGRLLSITFIVLTFSLFILKKNNQSALLNRMKNLDQIKDGVKDSNE